MDKILLQKIKDAYENQIKSKSLFTIDENKRIGEYIELGLLNEQAFIKIESLGARSPYYEQSEGNYPLTKEGTHLLGQSKIEELASKLNNHPVRILIFNVITLTISLGALVFSIFAFLASGD